MTKYQGRNIAFALSLCWATAANSADQHHHHHQHHDHAQTSATVTESNTLKLADVQLLDQHNQNVRVPELIKDKVVVMNFVYTSCEVTCQMLGYNFSRLAQLLDDRLGQEVELISVSVDPVVDTPARLKAWSDKFGGRAGWTQLTGEPTRVEALLKSLQVFSADKTEHSSLTLIGNSATGEWKRLDGLSSVSVLAQQVNNWLAES